jgi:hypothetical protein
VGMFATVRFRAFCLLSPIKTAKTKCKPTSCLLFCISVKFSLPHCWCLRTKCLPNEERGGEKNYIISSFIIYVVERSWLIPDEAIEFFQCT